MSRRELIRRCLRGVAGGLSIGEISETTGEPREGVKSALIAMRKRGEAIRTVRGIYCLAEDSGKARMWKLLTARKRATLEDLQVQAGVGQAEALEYLAGLKEAGIIREIGREGNDAVYRLIHDTGPETPLQGDDDVERMMAWAQIRQLRLKAEGAFLELTRAMEAYDEKYGEQPDRDAAA